MDFDVADGAVLELRTAQIVKSRRNATQQPGGVRPGAGRANIGVALQADKARFVADQHSRIHGPVRLMARRASFKLHRRMLKYEGAALVTVALEPAGLVREG